MDGLLAREGMRLGEALGLRWSDIDLQQGVITLDVNKTDDPGAWAMVPGTAEALGAFKPEGALASDFIFAAIEEPRLSFVLRSHL